MIDILNKQNFLENKNGRITEAQLSALKDKANIWVELYFWVCFIGFTTIIAKFGANLSWRLPLFSLLGITVIWFAIRLSVLVKYYLLVLPDARKANFAQAVVKLGYRGGYVLQTDDGGISLHCYKEDGFIAGNTYEVFFLERAKIAISAKLQHRVSDLEQAQEFTNIFGKAIGYTGLDIEENRNGRFSFLHKLNLLKRNRLAVLSVMILLLLIAWIRYILLINFFFPIFLLAFLLFIITLALISRSIHIFFVVLEGKVENAVGMGFVKAYIIHERGTRTEYYFVIPHRISMQIPKRVFNILVNGFYYRVYYTPRTKYLVSVEVLKLPQ